MSKALINVTYNSKYEYWAESLIKNQFIEFDNKKELKQKISELLKEKDFAINKNFRFQKVYRDIQDKTVHTGYYCTLTMEIQKDDYSWVKIPFEAWIDITLLSDKFLGDI